MEHNLHLLFNTHFLFIVLETALAAYEWVDMIYEWDIRMEFNNRVPLVPFRNGT